MIQKCAEHILTHILKIILRRTDGIGKDCQLISYYFQNCIHLDFSRMIFAYNGRSL